MSPYTQRQTQSYTQSRHRIRLTLKGVNILLGVAVIVLGLLYIGQINARATSGFVVSDLERDITTLKDQHRKLEVTATRIQSLSAIRDSADDLGLVARGSAEYLSFSTGSVAVEP